MPILNDQNQAAVIHTIDTYFTVTSPVPPTGDNFAATLAAFIIFALLCMILAITALYEKHRI